MSARTPIINTRTNASGTVYAENTPLSREGERLQTRFHSFCNNFAKPHRDPAALTFARLGLLGTRW